MEGKEKEYGTPEKRVTKRKRWERGEEEGKEEPGFLILKSWQTQLQIRQIQLSLFTDSNDYVETDLHTGRITHAGMAVQALFIRGRPVSNSRLSAVSI